MTNVLIVVTTADGDKVRVNASCIVSYNSYGHLTSLKLLTDQIYIQETPDQLDQILKEAYFMIKDIK